MGSLSLAYELVRPASDAGTLFVGDTEFKADVDTRNFSSGECVCRVSKATMTLSSHAGTHADNPPHYLKDGPKSFDDQRYSGLCVFLNLSQALTELAVTGELLFAERAKLPQVSPDHLKRVLLKTRSGTEYPKVAQAEFSYLSPEAVQLLIEWGTKVLFIDTPSVDAASEKNLAQASHGNLFRGDIAPLENIAPKDLPSSLGEVRTTFDLARSFTDARGVASVLYLPFS